MAATKTLEIEIDGPRNESHFFRPLQRRLRGRFDLFRCAEPQARMKSTEWPEPIPGLRIGLDLTTATGFVREPLHEPANSATKNRIAQRGFTLHPEREEFPSVHVPTWLFWLKRAVESGSARVVSGELPATIEGEPEKSFLVKRQASSNDRLAAAIEKNSQLLEALLSRLAK